MMTIATQSRGFRTCGSLQALAQQAFFEELTDVAVRLHATGAECIPSDDGRATFMRRHNIRTNHGRTARCCRTVMRM